jgi:CDP-diacylglycerol--glycerol-3-phosphate 3-phosphatidyltransferase
VRRGSREAARDADTDAQGAKDAGHATASAVNLPNAITLGRVLLVPPVLALWSVDDWRMHVAAAALFALASALDAVDGWLARRWELVTFFGKFVDPLADKVMVMAVLVYLVAASQMPAWIVVVLLTREFYVSGLRMLALGDGVEISADLGGKAKTFVQLAGLTACLVHHPQLLPALGLASAPLDAAQLGLGLVALSMVLSVVSAVAYTVAFARAPKRSPPDEPRASTRSDAIVAAHAATGGRGERGEGGAEA